MENNDIPAVKSILSLGQVEDKKQQILGQLHSSNYGVRSQARNVLHSTLMHLDDGSSYNQEEQVAAFLAGVEGNELTGLHAVATNLSYEEQVNQYEQQLQRIQSSRIADMRYGGSPNTLADRTIARLGKVSKILPPYASPNTPLPPVVAAYRNLHQSQGKK